MAKLDCQYAGDLDGSCVNGACWSYSHRGPRCPVVKLHPGLPGADSAEGERVIALEDLEK